METHNGILFQDVTSLPVLRMKLERAVSKVFPLTRLRGEKWALAKDIKGHTTIVSVGSFYGPVKYDAGTEEFVVEYMRKQVSH